MGLVAFDWGLMQSAESPGCYWILPKDHGETDRSLRPNYFWRLKLVETVLMTVDCIGSHQVYPWKIHETSIVGVCKVRNPAGTLVPFFRPRSIGSRNLFDLKHTHTSIGTSEASRIRMPKVENHALRRIFLQINMLSRWMIGPLDDSLVLTTGRELADDGFRYPSSHFWSLGDLGLSYIEVTPRSWENCVLYEYRNRNGFVVTVVRHLK